MTGKTNLTYVDASSMMQLQKEIRLSSQVIPDDNEGLTSLSCDGNDMWAVVEDKKPAALLDVKVQARVPTPVMENGANSLKAGVDELAIEVTLRKYAKH